MAISLRMYKNKFMEVQRYIDYSTSPMTIDYSLFDVSSGAVLLTAKYPVTSDFLSINNANFLLRGKRNTLLFRVKEGWYSDKHNHYIIECRPVKDISRYVCLFRIDFKNIPLNDVFQRIKILNEQVSSIKSTF